MESLTTQIERIKLIIANLHPGWIYVRVQAGCDSKSRPRSGVGNQVDDHLMTHQWTPTPVLCDMAKHRKCTGNPSLDGVMKNSPGLKPGRSVEAHDGWSCSGICVPCLCRLPVVGQEFRKAGDGHGWQAGE